MRGCAANIDNIHSLSGLVWFSLLKPHFPQINHVPKWGEVQQSHWGRSRGGGGREFFKFSLILRKH